MPLNYGVGEPRKAGADDPTTLRLSFDAKARVKLGPFSRKGKNRVKTIACDHDFASKAQGTPYGIFLPEWDELFLYCSTANVTSDFMVDVLEMWWLAHAHRFPAIQTLLLNQDNGPDNHSRRTQFMKRMVEFSQRHRLNIRLAVGWVKRSETQRPKFVGFRVASPNLQNWMLLSSHSLANGIG